MVVIIMAPSNLYQQLSGFFFLCTGFFIDLLVLRVFLLLANICLLVSAAIGRTSWLGLTRTEEEDDDDTNRFALDGVIWASLQIFINGMSVIRIYYDERKIVLNNDDEEALFRYVYRHSGLSKAQFQNAFCNNQRKKKKKTAGTYTEDDADEDEEENELKIVEYEPKEKINIDRKFFFIVLEGVVSSNVKMVGSNDRFHDTINFKSGQMFPIGFMAYDFMPTENIFMNTYITPIAATKVKLYRIPLQKIRSMSQNPKTRDAWMALIISMMASIAERPYINDENNNYDQSCVRSHLFDPFKENEEPNPLLAGSSSSSSSSSSLLLLFHPILHLLTYIKMSFTLPWPFDNYPTGLRHNLHPPIDPSKDAALFKRKQEIITSYRRSTLINEFKNSTKMHLIRTTSYGDDLQLLNNNNNNNSNNNNNDDIENNNNSDHRSLDESSTSTISNSKISIPLGDQQ
jgi:hypothetical protein